MPTSNITPELLAAAARENDINDAVKMVQDAIGVDTGDFAGMFFSGEQYDAWPDMHPTTRLRALMDYADAEQAHGRA